MALAQFPEAPRAISGRELERMTGSGERVPPIDRRKRPLDNAGKSVSRRLGSRRRSMAELHRRLSEVSTQIVGYSYEKYE